MTIGNFNQHSSLDRPSIEDIARLSTAWIGNEYVDAYGGSYEPPTGDVVAVQNIQKAGL